MSNVPSVLTEVDRTAAETLGAFAETVYAPLFVPEAVPVALTACQFLTGRALMRSELWTAGDQSGGLPSVGDMLAEAKAGFDGAGYDAGWAARAKDSMW